LKVQNFVHFLVASLMFTEVLPAINVNQKKTAYLPDYLRCVPF